jgi:two-component system, cell cycle response regulator
MSDQPIKVLLIEDNPGDVRLIREMLTEAAESEFALMTADSLQSGLSHLQRTQPAAVLLDLNLPDTQGLDTLTRTLTHCQNIVVVVLTDLDDHDLGVQAIKAGAQDYLVKGQVNHSLLQRAILYAIERHRMRIMLLNLSLMDELTGLYNRRGFMTLAQQQWKLAQRTHQQLRLFSADIDGMKQINDIYGHHEGDRALQKIAWIIQSTFRITDIKARLGGDEFTVLMIDCGPDSFPKIVKRLQRCLHEENLKGNNSYLLSLSWGAAQFDPSQPGSLEDMLKQADTALYADKRSKGPYDIMKENFAGPAAADTASQR